MELYNKFWQKFGDAIGRSGGGIGRGKITVDSTFSRSEFAKLLSKLGNTYTGASASLLFSTKPLSLFLLILTRLITVPSEVSV